MTKPELICYLHGVNGTAQEERADAAQLLLAYIDDDAVTRAYHVAIGVDHAAIRREYIP